MSHPFAYSRQAGRVPNEWINLPAQPVDRLTADEKIDQYFQWKDIYQKDMMAILERNLNKAKDAGEQLIEKLQTRKGITVRAAYLKMNEGIQSFNLLLLVDEIAYLADDFREAYVMAEEAEDALEEDIFQLHISFASFTDETREDNIFCQGYILKRVTDDEHPDQTPARPAQ